MQNWLFFHRMLDWLFFTKSFNNLSLSLYIFLSLSIYFLLCRSLFVCIISFFSLSLFLTHSLSFSLYLFPLLLRNYGRFRPCCNRKETHHQRAQPYHVTSGRSFERKMFYFSQDAFV